MCDGALKRGNMPLQAKANGLYVQLYPIPICNQLSGLHMLELPLISLSVVFMKIVALPKDAFMVKQCPIKDRHYICTEHPRLPLLLTIACPQLFLLLVKLL